MTNCLDLLSPDVRPLPAPSAGPMKHAHNCPRTPCRRMPAGDEAIFVIDDGIVAAVTSVSSENRQLPVMPAARIESIFAAGA